MRMKNMIVSMIFLDSINYLLMNIYSSILLHIAFFLYPIFYCLFIPFRVMNFFSEKVIPSEFFFDFYKKITRLLLVVIRLLRTNISFENRIKFFY